MAWRRTSVIPAMTGVAAVLRKDFELMLFVVLVPDFKENLSYLILSYLKDDIHVYQSVYINSFTKMDLGK